MIATITQSANKSAWTTRRPRRRGAFTLLEVMITMSIMVVVLSMISVSYLAMLRVERSSSVVLDFVKESTNLKNIIRQFAGAAIRIITDQGRRVVIEREDGTVSVIQFEDEDGNFETIDDNRIIFIRDNDNFADDELVIIKYVTPPNIGSGGIMTDMSGNTADPIFARQNPANPFSALLIEYVIGDYTADENASCHAVTGHGYQSYTFRIRMTPRNALRQ